MKVTINLPSLGKTVPVLVALALVGGLGFLVYREVEDRRYHERRADDRAAVVDVAQDQVLDLTTLDTKTVEGKLDAMNDRTTGDFRTQLNAMTSTFQNVVQEQTIKAVGSIASAAVAKLQDDAAEVLVVVGTSVTSAKKKGVDRSYRISVSLVREDEGWLIDGMEFVA